MADESQLSDDARGRFDKEERPHWWEPYRADFERIGRAVDLASGFALIPVELPGPSVAAALGEWLTTRGNTLRQVRPQTPADWANLVPALTEPFQQSRPVVLVAGPTESRQNEPGLAEALRLLNQRRDTVAKQLGCPLVWCGPATFLDATWRLAPDFWSVADVPRRLSAAPKRWEPTESWSRPLKASVEESTPQELAPLYEAAKTQGDKKNAARLGVRLAEAWIDNDDWTSARRTLDEVLPLANENGGTLEGSARSLMGYVLVFEGKLANAEHELLRALVAFQHDANEAGEANVHTQLADVNMREGRPQQAERHLQRALQLHDKLNNAAGEATTQLLASRMLHSAGRKVGADLAQGSFGDRQKRALFVTSRDLRAQAVELCARGRWDEAQPLFLKAIQLENQDGSPATTRAITLHEYARGLRDNGRFAEAEPLFRAALELHRAGGDSGSWQALVLREYARSLRDSGRFAEAEPLFRQAIELHEQGSSSHRSRAITLDAYARGLRDSGRFAEAEPLFRQAIELHEQGGSSAIWRVATLDQYACGLRSNGRFAEAEPLFRQAIELHQEGGSSPESRAFTLLEYARGLNDTGRFAEAEPLFRMAIDLHEQGRSSASSRAVSLDLYARALRDTGRFAEAEPLFQRAMDLQEQGGSSGTWRAFTADHYARGLRDNGRFKEAELLFHEAMRLKREGRHPASTQALTMDHYARGLRDTGRFAEAEPLFVEAIADLSATATPDYRERKWLVEALEAYAQGLRQAGRPLEADAMEARAKTLRESLESG